jgi:NAD-dependent SIR2 family protein deacetylase
MKESLVDPAEPTLVHWFMRMLDLKQQLLRLYSQNVDGLEITTGMEDYEKVEDTRFKGGVVFLHGNLNYLRCEICHFRFPWNAKITHLISEGVTLTCPVCLRRSKSMVKFP